MRIKDRTMIATGLLIGLAAVSVVTKVRDSREAKRQADARRRESMRKVAENWHFREWERDLRSRGSV
jgi:hypothetical protein